MTDGQPASGSPEQVDALGAAPTRAAKRAPRPLRRGGTHQQSPRRFLRRMRSPLALRVMLVLVIVVALALVPALLETLK